MDRRSTGSNGRGSRAERSEVRRGKACNSAYRPAFQPACSQDWLPNYCDISGGGGRVTLPVAAHSTPRTKVTWKPSLCVALAL